MDARNACNTRRGHAGLLLGLALVLSATTLPVAAQVGPCPFEFANGFEDGPAPPPFDPAARCTLVPAASIGMVGVTFNAVQGDLDVSLRTPTGACMAGRIDDACAWTIRNFETGDEILSVLNWRTTDLRQHWNVVPFNGLNVASSRFDAALAYGDAGLCTDRYPADACEGRPGGVPTLLQFPLHDATDPYIGDGFRLQSPANYRWIRLELLMLVRDALHRTQQQFPGTRPLGVGDICQRDTITPGYDIGQPRHPEFTHDQGGNIDLAYFSTLADQGTIPFNQLRSICNAAGGGTDGFYCSPGSAATHVVDLPRQVYFMAQLYSSPRMRVAGVDREIAPLLRIEADRQLAIGLITQSQRNAFYSTLGFGDGWQFMFNFIHVSLRYWVN
jgi:hypothetical protein